MSGNTKVVISRGDGRRDSKARGCGVVRFRVRVVVSTPARRAGPGGGELKSRRVRPSRTSSASSPIGEASSAPSSPLDSESEAVCLVPSPGGGELAWVAHSARCGGKAGRMMRLGRAWRGARLYTEGRSGGGAGAGR